MQKKAMDDVLGDINIADPSANIDSDREMADVAPRAVQKQEKQKKDKSELSKEERKKLKKEAKKKLEAANGVSTSGAGDEKRDEGKKRKHRDEDGHKKKKVKS